MLRKVFSIASLLFSGWCLWSLWLLAKFIQRNSPDGMDLQYYSLVATIILGAIFAIATIFNLRQDRLSLTCAIVGVAFYCCLIYFGGETLLGIIGLALLIASSGKKVPQGLFVAALVLNPSNVMASWFDFSSQMNYTQPAYNFSKITDNFISQLTFYLKTPNNESFKLKQIDNKTWGNTFTKATRFEAPGGAYFSFKANTDVKVSVTNTYSWGATYKMETSKPASLGFGLAAVKFTSMTFEVANHGKDCQTFRVVNDDLRGNKWLENFIHRTMFDFTKGV